MAPHTPQRSSRPGGPVARLDVAPRAWGPEMAPHTPQRSSRPRGPGGRLEGPPRGRGPQMAPHGPQRSSRPGEAGPRLDTPQRLSRLVSVVGLSIRGGPLWALFRAGDAGALEAVEYGRE